MSTTLLVLIILCLAFLQLSTSSEDCTQQLLLRCRPRDLGVMPINLMGEMFNTELNVTKTVLLRGLVKLFKTNERTVRLFGYGMIDDGELSPNGWPMPKHAAYMSNLDQLKLRLVTYDASLAAPVLIHRADDKVLWSKDLFGFRMDAEVPASNETVFYLIVEGWRRFSVLNLHDYRVYPSLITPWRNMPAETEAARAQDALQVTRSLPRRAVVAARAAALRRGRQLLRVPLQHLEAALVNDTALRNRLNDLQRFPPVSKSPFVAVLWITATPKSWVFNAQEILRWVEYYTIQAGFQRVLVYIRQGIYMDPSWRAYVARHIPPEARPYVTFVLWNQDLEWDGWSNYDQLITYYHAAVALSPYDNVMAAYLDIDEWLSWPRPTDGSLVPKTVQEAFAKCNTTKQHYFPLAALHTLCASCVSQYNTTNDVERRHWLGCESATAAKLREQPLPTESAANAHTTAPLTNSASSKYCGRWYQADPLLTYNMTWDRKSWKKFFFVEWEERTAPGVWENHGKAIMRVQEATAFNMHRAELFHFEPQHRSVLDHEFCPYYSHFYNLHGYRGHDGPGGLSYFENHQPNKWFLLPPVEQ